MDRSVAHFGIAILIRFQLPVEGWIGFVDFKVPVAVEPQNHFEDANTERERHQGQPQLLHKALEPRSRGLGSLRIWFGQIGIAHGGSFTTYHV